MWREADERALWLASLLRSGCVGYVLCGEADEGGVVVGFAVWEWVCWGFFCAAKRMRGCCGWFRCEEGAFVVGMDFALEALC